MTSEEYEKKYNSKTTKQLCNQWRKYYIKKYKEWEDNETVKLITKITDEDIIKFGLSKILEELNNEKN